MDRTSSAGPSGRFRRALLRCAGTVAICTAVFPAAAHFGPDWEIRVVSSRPNLVSGGDAVIEVQLPRYARKRDVVVRLNGADVTDQLSADSSGAKLTGSGQRHAGRQEPSHCWRQAAKRVATRRIPGGGELTQSPVRCSGPISVRGFAKPRPRVSVLLPQRARAWLRPSTSGSIAPHPAHCCLAGRPAAGRCRDDHHDRRQHGELHRARRIRNDQRIHLPHRDPGRPRQPVRNPWSPTGKKPGPGWNGKLFYHFVGGAAAGFRSGAIQRPTRSTSPTRSRREMSPASRVRCGHGDTQCLGTGSDEVVSAETVMMVKERFIEQYGVPKYTVRLG